MITYVDVFCPRAEFWKTGKFKGARVIFKNFTIHGRLGTNDLEVSFAEFIHELHDGDDVPQCHRHGNILGFCSGESYLGLEL
jgi:hypothetical protein